MPQSLTQLPKTTEFKIWGRWIVIDDHEVINHDGLFVTMMHVINDEGSDKQTLYQFEKEGINFESAIERCAYELEYDPQLIALFIWDYVHPEIRKFDANVTWSEMGIFSESVACRKIVEQLIDKIRSCNDWQDFYDEMQETTKFHKDVKKRMIKELKEQNRIKEEIKQ